MLINIVVCNSIKLPVSAFVGDKPLWPQSLWFCHYSDFHVCCIHRHCTNVMFFFPLHMKNEWLWLLKILPLESAVAWYPGLCYSHSSSRLFSHVFEQYFDRNGSKLPGAFLPGFSKSGGLLSGCLLDQTITLSALTVLHVTSLLKLNTITTSFSPLQSLISVTVA